MAYKFKKREPIMDPKEREIWDQIQALYILLGFENVAFNIVDTMYARKGKELLWELKRFSKTGIMNLDPIMS